MSTKDDRPFPLSRHQEREGKPQPALFAKIEQAEQQPPTDKIPPPSAEVVNVGEVYRQFREQDTPPDRAAQLCLCVFLSRIADQIGILHDMETPPPPPADATTEEIAYVAMARPPAPESEVESGPPSPNDNMRAFLDILDIPDKPDPDTAPDFDDSDFDGPQF